MQDDQLSTEASDEMKAWLATMSKRQELRENVDAMALELDVISRALFRAGAKTPDRVRTIFNHLKEKVGMIYWPTAKDIEDARRGVVVRGSDPELNDKGDRRKLSSDESFILDDRILPAARRFLLIPALKQNGEKTLEYWGETT